MATIRLTNLILNGRKWPGVPTPYLGVPTNGWDNTVDNFSSADETARALNGHKSGVTRVPIGQKRQAYTDNTNAPGYYTMMYLCLHSFEDGMDISADFSDGNFFHAHSDLTSAATAEWQNTSGIAPYFVLSRCTTGSDFTKAGSPIAIFCSTKTYSDGTKVSAQGYGDGYGWAWVDGVCPCKDITIFDDGSGNKKGVDLTVDTATDRGVVFLENTGGCALLMDADESNVNDVTTGIVTGLEPASLAIGWVCASAA